MNSNTVVISGGTGLIGSATKELFLKKGWNVRILTRFPEKYQRNKRLSYHFWDWKRKRIDEKVFDGAEYFIHLAGANIAEKRWTEKYKAEIAGSRILSLKFIREFLIEKQKHLKHFAGASAIGYYGCLTDENIRTENDGPGNDFLAKLVVAWEEESERMKQISRRVSILRTGVVFDKYQGAFPKIFRPLKWGMPLVIGNGKQYVNWIALDDIAAIYQFVLEEEKEGIFNAVSPGVLTYEKMVRVILKYLKRNRCCFHFPAELLHLFLGEKACLVTEGMPISSEKLKQSGFIFKFEKLIHFLNEE